MTEIYNNFDPKIAKALDKRLDPVNTIGDLPDPLVASNFLYEGIKVYVSSEGKDYRLKNISSVLQWVVADFTDLVVGTVNLTNGTTVLDLSLVTPSINLCDTVLINIIGGTSMTLQSILNFPNDDRPISFRVEAGKQVTFKHIDYDIATTGQIVLETGFDTTITGRAIGDEELILKKNGIAVCQWGAIQFMKASEWLTALLNVAIVDNLTTQDSNKALSAKQGYVLDQKINTKQQILQAGRKVQLVPGTTNTIINVIPESWVPLVFPSSPSASIATLTYLVQQATALVLTAIDNYRVVDLRSNPPQAGGNRGLWIVPPNLNPQSSASWICLDKETGYTGVAQYKYVDEGASGTYFFPRIKTDTLVGDDLFLNFNTDGAATSKVSVGFSLTGLYEISIDLTMNYSPAVGNKNLNGELYITNGVQLAANPINTGVVVKKVPGNHSSVVSSQRIAQFTVTYLLNVTAIATSSGFTFRLEESSNNWTDLSTQLGTIIIKKLK